MITIKELEDLYEKLKTLSDNLSEEERIAHKITTSKQVEVLTLAEAFAIKFQIFLSERKTNECKL
jgi:hypothetical protein